MASIVGLAEFSRRRHVLFSNGNILKRSPLTIRGLSFGNQFIHQFNTRRHGVRIRCETTELSRVRSKKNADSRYSLLARFNRELGLDDGKAVGVYSRHHGLARRQTRPQGTNWKGVTGRSGGEFQVSRSPTQKSRDRLAGESMSATLCGFWHLSLTTADCKSRRTRGPLTPQKELMHVRKRVLVVLPPHCSQSRGKREEDFDDDE
ncbi:hypothetical protein V8F20_009932 [Naviculisporaceae sp. PSN 640]